MKLIGPGPMTEMKKGNYTDDTELMIGLTEGLLDCESDDGIEFDLDVIADALRDVFTVTRGYGGSAKKVLTAMKAGWTWDKAAAAHRPPGGSQGNGAAMRVAPIGLAFYRSWEQTSLYAARQGRITGHSSDLGEWGARIQALAVREALLRGAAGEPFGRDDFIGRLLADQPPPEFAQKLRWIQGHPAKDPGPAIEQLGNRVRAQVSVPIALWCAVTFPEDPAQAIGYAAAIGGDTDTIAAMAGAIAGAYHGADALPKIWVDRLENEARGRDHVIGLADDLYALTHVMG